MQARAAVKGESEARGPRGIFSFRIDNDRKSPLVPLFQRGKRHAKLATPLFGRVCILNRRLQLRERVLNILTQSMQVGQFVGGDQAKE